jgi:thiol-disulfide isomerase/thioredoxin
MTRPLLTVAALLAFCLTGCPDSSAPNTLPSTASSNTASPAAPTEVTLVTGDEKDLDALIAKHKGQVVFVDYWATYCKPCVKSFPHTVELHKQHQREGLAVISVNLDYLDDEPKVKEFLEKQGATFDNLISKYDGGGSDANDAFDIGPLPHLRLYDRQGKLRHQWEGKAADLDAKIKELLAEK